MAASSHGIACNLGDGTQDSGTGKIFSQALRQPLRCRESAVGNDEALAIFAGTLQGNRPCCAATAQDHHPQIAQIDGKFLPNGAGKSFPIGIVATKFCALDLYRIDRTGAPGVVINFVHQFGSSDLVRGRLSSPRGSSVRRMRPSAPGNSSGEI